MKNWFKHALDAAVIVLILSIAWLFGSMGYAITTGSMK